jgi:PTS system nitrogen regulatory IIA component
MLRRGEIPAAKVASQWRFLRSVLHDWLASRMEQSVRRSSGGDKAALALPRMARPELILTDVTPGSVETVLRQLTGRMASAGVVRDEEALLRSLLARESMMSTAMGNGVAVPHPRRPIPGMFPEPVVLVGICREGTDFASLDCKPVHVFFLIGAPREEVHLQMMARIALFARREGVIDALSRASSPDDVVDLLQQNA